MAGDPATAHGCLVPDPRERLQLDPGKAYNVMEWVTAETDDGEEHE